MHLLMQACQFSESSGLRPMHSTSSLTDAAQLVFEVAITAHLQQSHCIKRYPYCLQEVLARRVHVVCGPDTTDSKGNAAIAMYFVTAGEVAQLRAVEGFLGSAGLEVMPVHVADILQQTRQMHTSK